VLLPSTPTTIKRVAALMKRYRDVPMDYADATLVALSEDLDTDRVFTLNLLGFRTYRKNVRVPFHVLPE
jgi:predicted nucleic acid-binding protein